MTVQQAEYLTHIPSVGKLRSPRAWLDTVDYRLCLSIPMLQEYVHPYLLAKVSPGLDWETTSLNVWKGHLVGLCLSFETGKGLYVPVAHFTGSEYNLPLGGVIDVLKAIDAADVEQYWYNYRFDSAIMRQDAGWEPTFGKWKDVMFGPFLADPNIKVYGLKFTAQRLLGIDMIEYTEKVGPGEGFHMLHPEDAPPYGCADADMARRIHFLPEVQRALSEQAFIRDLEHKCLLPIRDAVDKGVWLDHVRLIQLWNELGAVEKDKKGNVVSIRPGMIADARAEVIRIVGYEFNVDSGPQLGQALLKLGVPIEEKTDGGAVATGQEVLERYAAKWPVCKSIVKYKKLTKQGRDYIGALVSWVRKYGAHARFAFNQIGAPTGRMSAGGAEESEGYVDLNVQSIPDHEKEAYLPNIRASFIANDPAIAKVAEDLERKWWANGHEAMPGYELPSAHEWGDEWVIVAIDYSQIELRVAGNLFREPLWIEAFLRGDDIHMINARLAYRDPTITKNSPKRKMGKTMNFATLFGAQPKTVAEHGNISEQQAEELMENFFGAAHKLKEGIDSYQRQARADKWVKTFFGRKRPLAEYYDPDAPWWLQLKGDREAVNHPIQGSAADIFKIACFKVRSTLIKNGWYGKDWFPVLFVHDELVSIVRRARLYEMLPVVREAMEFPVKDWPIPIKTDAEVGWNWGELLAWEDWQERFPPETARERLVTWLALSEIAPPVYNPETAV